VVVEKVHRGEFPAAATLRRVVKATTSSREAFYKPVR
jgi:hypothetical protein